MRPYPTGRFPLDSPAFTYWKVAAALTSLAEKTLRPFVTVFSEPWYHAAFGPHVGRHVGIAGVLRDHPLLHFGDGATVGQNSVITAHTITRDEIALKEVHLGRNAVVGVASVVMPA